MRALMLQGTGSDVGKSILVAGLCRILARRGHRVVPFKPQNMSNNAAVVSGGGEIGRAQWLQAVAARVPPSVDMNPVLLKPESDIGAQVVVHGRVFATARASDYGQQRAELFAAVMDSYRRLSAEADFIVVEGAGSPAETNLRAHDIANMGFATHADVPVVLVGDIDRGGVIASIVGTHAVLDDIDRRQVRGIIINKFRGDVGLFDAGLAEIERRCWPCFGVVPWLAAARRLPAEDAVVLDAPARDIGGIVRIAIPLLGRISNFDDFDPLKAEPNVRVEFIPPGTPFPAGIDLIILPGTKSSIDDMRQLVANGWHHDIHVHVRQGGRVLGICGGYQLLGRRIEDPMQVESSTAGIDGLGLLDVTTVMQAAKQVRHVCGTHIGSGSAVEGYEIHAGETSGRDCERPYLEIEGRQDGAVSADGRVAGCYVHGLFGSDVYRKALLESVRPGSASDLHYEVELERNLDELADGLEASLDIEGLVEIAQEAAPGTASKSRVIERSSCHS